MKVREMYVNIKNFWSADALGNEFDMPVSKQVSTVHELCPKYEQELEPWLSFLSGGRLNGAVMKFFNLQCPVTFKRINPFGVKCSAK